MTIAIHFNVFPQHVYQIYLFFIFLFLFLKSLGLTYFKIITNDGVSYDCICRHIVSQIEIYPIA